MAADNAPRGSGPLLWLLGVITVGGAALFGIQGLPNQHQSTKQPAESAKDEKKSELASDPGAANLLHVLRDHLRVAGRAEDKSSKLNLQFKMESGAGSVTVSVDGKRSTRRDPESLSVVLLKEPARYEFLIATVPDPVESKFPHEFDAVLDGIQRAFEARDFVLRASWLPWPRGREREGAPAGTGAPLRHRENPGVLLFRKSRPQGVMKEDEKRLPTFALVCLVGESPISGVHMPALSRALSAWHELDRGIKAAGQAKSSIQWASSSGDRIALVAPFFSGSQWSLIFALRQWREEMRWQRDERSLLQAVGGGPIGMTSPPSLRIVSGSATALNPSLFTNAELPPPETTVIPNELVTRGVLSYLTGYRGLDPDKTGTNIPHRVAILREANTTFGAQAFQSGGKIGLHNNDSGYLAEGVIDLPFPMSISQLEVGQEKNAKPLLPQTGFVESKLPVRDQTHLDAIPPYDPASAAATAGQNLRVILSTIARSRVRYVGIVATDVRDVVLLNRLLRKECPNVRVFTTEPSIALLHPDEAYHLRGMVVGSTYPLAPVTQEWVRTPNSNGPGMIAFPTQGSQGYYNAVLAQFGQTDMMLGYHPPNIPGVTRLNRPPIWISVVGHSGQLVPVHCYTDYNTESGSGESPSTHAVMVVAPGESPRKPTVGVPLGVLLGSLGAVAALGVVLFALMGGRVWRKVASGLTPAEVTVDKLRDSLWVWVWRGVMLAGVLLFALPYALPAGEMLRERCCGVPGGGPDWRAALTAGWRHWFIIAMSAILTMQIAALVVLLALRGGGVLPSAPGAGRWGYIGLAIIVLVVGFGTLVWWYPRTPVERFFLYVRATDLSAGLSPVIPMSLLGTAAFTLGWYSLRQADLSRRTRLSCPYPSPWKRIASADESLRGDFHHHLLFLRNTRTLVVTLGLGIPFFLTLMWNVFVIPLPSGEGSTWDWIMRVTFWAAAFAVVLTLARFLSLWARLKTLLEEILRVPMVGAFERLPHVIGQIFGGYLYSQRPRHRQLAAAAWALPVQARQELATEIADARPGLAWVFGQPPPPTPPALPNGDEADRRDREDRQWLADRLQETAEEYLNELPGEWQDRPTDEAFGAERRGERPEGAERAREPAVAAATGATPEGTTEPTAAEKESYVAAFVVMYLGGYFAQLRMLVYAVVFAAPLLLFAAASYPFQPDRPRLLALIGLLIAAAVGTVYVLYRINKDGLVSRITRTTPDRFTPDTGFLSSLTTYVLPLVAILGLQMLGLFRFIVEPLVGLFE